jgi:hypothetical protein
MTTDRVKPEYIFNEAYFRNLSATLRLKQLQPQNHWPHHRLQLP